MSDLLITVPMVGLPQSFINSLKQLFNILCGENSNIINLEELEEQCKNDDDRLPNDVILALRGLSHTGEIDFDKFVSAIRIASSNTYQIEPKQKYNYKTLYESNNEDTQKDGNIAPIKRLSYSNHIKRDYNNNQRIYNCNTKKEQPTTNSKPEPFEIHPPISPIFKNIPVNKKKNNAVSKRLGHHAMSMPNLDQINEKQYLFEKNINYDQYSCETKIPTFQQKSDTFSSNCNKSETNLSKKTTVTNIDNIQARDSLSKGIDDSKTLGRKSRKDLHDKRIIPINDHNKSYGPEKMRRARSNDGNIDEMKRNNLPGNDDNHISYQSSIFKMSTRSKRTPPPTKPRTQKAIVMPKTMHMISSPISPLVLMRHHSKPSDTIPPPCYKERSPPPKYVSTGKLQNDSKETTLDSIKRYEEVVRMRLIKDMKKENVHPNPNPFNHNNKSVFAPPLKDNTCRKIKNRDARRHTLSSGMEIININRCRELDEIIEKLKFSHEIVENTRLWIDKNIEYLQTSKSSINTSTKNNPSKDVNHERMKLQSINIVSIVKQLHFLISDSKNVLSFNLNQATCDENLNKRGEDSKDTIIEKLKKENQSIKKDLQMKVERVTQLEKQKLKFLKELFVIDSKTPDDDSIFV